MKSLVQFQIRLARAKLHLPAALLIALLQRTPAVRVFAVADELVASSPLGLILKSVVAAAASLGAVHSMAGATVLAASQNSPVTTKAGTSNTTVAFTVTNTINIASWRIGGSVPPGMTIAARENPDVSLSGPGTLDATGGGVNDGYGGMIGGTASTTPIISGTPTTPGNYTFTLQAFEFGALSGLASGTFNFTINVTAADTAPTTSAPSFTTQPQAAAAQVGGTVTLTAAASGSPTPTFQWSKNGVAISGATSATLVLSSAQVSDGGSYTVMATNSAGNVVSTAATVTISSPGTPNVAPSIAQAAASRTVATGSTAVFTVTASGTPTPSYQWKFNGSDLVGATDATLVVQGATAASAGSYTVLVSNSQGSVLSTAATLAVATTADPGRLINLSILTPLEAGEKMTLGTVLGGNGVSGTKPVLVRAGGPALTALGVGGVLPDPTMVINNTSGSAAVMVATNDNWGGTQELRNAFTATGAFGFGSSTSLDAAIFQPSLAPGSYTVDVSDAGSGSGTVIAELYDATSASAFTSTTPRLINVSVFKRINTGTTLTVGFVVGGSTAKTLLIRAVGPGLIPLGVGGTMADPTMTLTSISVSPSVTVATNNDWAGTTAISQTATRVGAFAVNNGASKDATLLVTLAPGNYTAQVGPAGEGGYAIVEVYDVP